MIYRKIAAVILLLIMCLLCTGCRSRTTGTVSERSMQQDNDGTAVSEIDGERPDMDGTAETDGNDESDLPGDKTFEDPSAARKEYDEQAQSEIIPGTSRSIHGEGDGQGSPHSAAESDDFVTALDDQADRSAIQTVSADHAEQMGVSDDADEADSAMVYYTVLLQDHNRSLFECQRLNLYWETAEDLVTVYKNSMEHDLILNAGCYDVSARLLAENLHVEDGWVIRKDPGMIVRIVSSDVLGRGVLSPAAAKVIYTQLIHREGWSGIDAVRNGRVLLISEEMLQAPYLQLAATVLIAKTANPALYADTDIEKMFAMLAEEATGNLPSGIWYYHGEE